MDQESAITIERVRALYEKSFAGTSSALVGAFIFTYIFWGQIASPLLLVWLGFMCIVAVARYWLLANYNEHKTHTQDHDIFEKRFIYATGMVGIGWAFFIVSGMLLPTFEYRIYSLLLLVSIVALSVPLFSSSLRTVYFYIAPSLIIAIPLLLSRGGNDAGLGAALIVFTMMVIRSSRDSYKTLNDTLVLRFKTQEQAESLRQLRYEKSVSEQRMEAIMDNSPAVIYAKDLDGRYIFINKQWEELFDKESEGVIGKTDHELFPKEFADSFVLNDRKVMSAGHAMESEEIAPQEDGLHTYVTVKFPLLDDRGSTYGICGISTDISERKKMEDEIHSSEQHLKLYRKQAPMATIEWTPDFQVIDWNKAAEKMFGYTVDEVKGRDFVDIMLPETAVVDVKQIWKDLMAQTGGELSINENLTKDGRIILCEWHNTPIKDESGKVIGAASIVQDITERTQKDEQFRRSQKMDALGKLTGGIAHDYNNMLGVILGYSELLKGSLSAKSKLVDYVQHIHHAAERGAKLTEKLLAFTRHKSSNKGMMNINSLLQYEKDMLEKTLTARIKLSYELADELWPVWLCSDELEDAIINMSINAMHAIDGEGRLTIQTRNLSLDGYGAQSLELPVGEYVLLSLTDTGCGMDSTTTEKIFDPFYSTKGVQGTGLGLSQVYGFVQRSNGAIKVFSELGVNTQLDLYFPRYYESESDCDNGSVDDVQDYDLKGKGRILVVDDEPALLGLTAEILGENGYHVICAGSGKEALQILENESIDLLFSDVIMPEMSGYQLAKIVNEKYPEIVIQLASGFNDDQNSELSGEGLHKEILYKPYDAETLLIRMRELLI